MMRATVDGISVEGTPREIAELLKALKAGRPSLSETKMPNGNAEISSVDRHPYLNEDTAFRALKRRPLSQEQKTFLSELAKRHPEWTLSTELQKMTEYSKAQFSGMLGALGKRVSGTEGYQDGTWFYDNKWDYDDDCYGYRLPEHLVEVVKRAVK
jgi:hypothetical protein